MRWLFGCLLALVMVSAAFAGEDPYIAVVGNDIDANRFYFSPKHEQFLYDQTLFSVPVCSGGFPSVPPQTRVGGLGCEQFRSNSPINQPEICDTTGTVNNFAKGDFDFFGEPNAVVRAGNAGYFEWFVRLPKKPSGQINLCFQCGILKPNTFTPFTGFNAVEECAAETGERIGKGFCTRDQVDPGVNPIVNSALPTIFASGFKDLDSFFLSAFKNPSSYVLTDTVTSSSSFQVLDGTSNARILLKSCMDKCIVVKLPVEGQIIGINVPERALEAGDLIHVVMKIPRQNTVDIYCHSQSLKVMGIGESPW